MNITVLLVKTTHSGYRILSKSIINLDIVTLKNLLDESSMLIFERDNSDNSIILNAYAKT